MKAHSIVIEGNDISEFGYKNLVNSSNQVGNDFDIAKFDAVTPENVDESLVHSGVKWNYPWTGQVVDFASGLVKTAYTTAHPLKRVACAMSHFYLWKMCAEQNEPFLILEHDSLFTNKIDFNIMSTRFQVLGINNPLNATRRSKVFYDKILRSVGDYMPAPYVDDDIKVPQGLAGNSAYIITPNGADALVNKVYDFGLWPNDAIMCRQLFPLLGVTRKFYTKIQLLQSTTSL